METRILFWGLNSSAIVAFYILGLSALAIFLWGCWQHLKKYKNATAPELSGNLKARMIQTIGAVLSHRSIARRDLYVGIAHAFIFFGFIIAVIGTGIITIEADITYPLFGVKFWKGSFYLWYSLIVDIGGILLFFGLLAMAVRRAFFNFPRFDYKRHYEKSEVYDDRINTWKREDWLFLLVMLIIVITGFLQEGLRLFIDQPEWAIWSPVGLLCSLILDKAGLSSDLANNLLSINWWLHGLLGLLFVATVPYYKAKHLIAAVGTLALRDEEALRCLPGEREDAETVGISKVSDFSLKDLLAFDACTRCGRCQDACPAFNSSYPLNPRDLILDLRNHTSNFQKDALKTETLFDDGVKVDALWSCRSCGACQEICPVGIEHPELIVRLRRQLVDRGEMDPLLQKTLETIGDTGNSFGRISHDRSIWTRDLEFKIKDIRNVSAEVLWFVGDYASFDPRIQEVSRTVARLFRVADLDYGILYEGERNSGNDIRRVGEEGLFESLVEHNQNQFLKSQRFTKLVTTDPHSYNSIKNEYPKFGDTELIEHYSTLLLKMLQTGQLKVIKPLGKVVTFHDPCQLGRINGEYETPREILRIIGCDIKEMPRNRDNSFCCGAGGGRIWVPDIPGTEKASENRMHEAASLGGIDYLVTCCPKDLIMFEDARKTSGHGEDFEVKDLAELIAEAIDLKAITIQDLPALSDRIADRIATKIADGVFSRLDQLLSARFGDIPLVQSDLSMPKELPGQLSSKSALIEKESETDPENGTFSEKVEEKKPIVQTAVVEKKELAAMDWDHPVQVIPADFEDYEKPEKEGVRILVAVKHIAILADEYNFTSNGCDVSDDCLDYSLNEWDDFALEEALLLKEKFDTCEVVAVTVGPESADISLRKVLAKGADRGVRIWHDRLQEADPITIAKALAGVAVKEQADLILTGAQSGDYGHGATGIALASILDLPHIAVVIGVEWDGESHLKATRELEGGLQQKMELKVPAVLSIQTGTSTPRFATMRMIKKAKKKPLITIDAVSMAADPGHYLVKKMYTPEVTRAEMIEGNADDIATAIMTIIQEKQGD
jgi:Fe-S oxidoreductase/electron transfer flavoprotein alpha/beta subunit